MPLWKPVENVVLTPAPRGRGLPLLLAAVRSGLATAVRHPSVVDASPDMVAVAAREFDRCRIAGDDAPLPDASSSAAPVAHGIGHGGYGVILSQAQL